MKLEMGESLCYSYLRHVKNCWLVQTNWKPSEHWRVPDKQMEEMFQEMRQQFYPGRSVFKQTIRADQLIKQGEIDVLGLDLNGNVHAIEVAFHEAGLLYGNGIQDTADRVLMKMLRAYLLLRFYIPNAPTYHIYFVSPKVSPRLRDKLADIFKTLQGNDYPKTEWNLIINDRCADLVKDTIDKSSKISDTSELFVRSVKLFDLANKQRTRSNSGKPNPNSE